MLAWAGRAWRAWRAKARLMAPLLSGGGFTFADSKLHFPDLPGGPPGAAPELRPYEGLAAVWDWYGAQAQPDYPSFLDALATARGRPIQSVLDLGCGTGILAARLAAGSRQVVGLDSSPDMLDKARVRCDGLPGVRLIEGDFRDFRLGQTFDAAVCGSNSLNYVSDTDELQAVFRVVADHLRSGGVFVFDTVTDWGMRWRSGMYLHAQMDGTRFALRLTYDAARRRQEAEALLPAGVEVHRRVPIDPEDVVRATRGTGLRVDDYFSSAVVPEWLSIGPYCFFVLTRKE